MEEEQRKLAQQMEETKVDKASKSPKSEQSTVLYTCELFGEDEALPKSEVLTLLKNKLLDLWVYLNCGFTFFSTIEKIEIISYHLIFSLIDIFKISHFRQNFSI